MEKSFISTTTLILLGLLLLFVALGVIFGTVRGGKRAAIRLVLVIFALSVALLLTPVTSKMLVNIKIPGLGKSGGDYIKEDLFGSSTVMTGIANSAPNIVDFVTSCAVVIVNFIMFFIMYYIFKSLSWIVYAVIAHNVAPKKDKESGEKIEQHRLAGAIIGLVTGLVFFGFFMIPVNGSLQTLNAASGYKSNFAGYSVSSRASIIDDGGVSGTLASIDKTLDDVNGDLQASAFGKITKYTGMQALGGWSMGYLSTIRTKGHTINVKNDLINFGRTASDGVAIAVNLTSEGDFLEKIQSWTPNDYEIIEKMIARVFDSDIIKSSLGYTNDIVGVLEDNKALDSTFEQVPGAEGDDDFVKAAYDGICVLGNAANIKNDLTDVVEICKILFAQGADNEVYGLYYKIKDVIDNIGTEGQSSGDLSAAINALVDKLAAPFDKKHPTNGNNAKKLMSTIFDFKILRALLTPGEDGYDLTSLYTVPVSSLLDMDDLGKDDIKISKQINWDGISNDSANLLVELLKSFNDLSGVIFADGDDVIDNICSMSVDNIADVLDTLTNSADIGKLVRKLAVKGIDSIDISDTEESFIDVNEVVNRFKEQLDSDPVYNPIEWKSMLELIQKAVKFISKAQDFENIDIDEFSSLLQSIIGNPIFGDLVANALTNAINDITNGMISIDLTDPDIAKSFVVVISDNVESFMDIFSEDGGYLNTSDPNALLNIFGAGSEGGELLLQLAKLNLDNETGQPKDVPVITIDISGLIGDDPTYEGALIEIIEHDYGENADLIKLLFGLIA